MKLDTHDKDNICGQVARPFFTLAKRIDGKTTKKLAFKVFREDIVPPLLDVKRRFPQFWNRLDKASHFAYETPPQPALRYNRYYGQYNHREGSACLEIPADLIPERIPVLAGITQANSYGRADNAEVSQARMRAKASEEDRETIQKAHDLRMKGTRVRELLTVFLEKFTMPEQVPFSLPQLNYFLSRMDFRKRNRWSDKTPMSLQKRPRVVVVPPPELRQLVMEATLLHQSLPEKELED